MCKKYYVIPDSNRTNAKNMFKVNSSFNLDTMLHQNSLDNAVRIHNFTSEK